MFKALVKRLGKRKQSTPPVKWPRLCCEQLEGRDCPSAATWLGNYVRPGGSTAYWNDYQNWSTNQVPGSGDDVWW